MKKYLIALYYYTVGPIVLLVFISLGIFLLIFFNKQNYDPWFKKLVRLFLKCYLLRIEVSGLENIDKNKNYIFMANHGSWFDIPVLGAYIPVFFRGVEAAEHFDWPIYGHFLKKYGNIPIDRKNVRNSMKSLQQAQEMLKDGKSITIMPEGTRTKDGNLLPFKKLPFMFAKQSDVEIIPIGMVGLYELKAKNDWKINLQPIKLRFGKPIPVSTIKELKYEELMSLVRSEILKLMGD